MNKDLTDEQSREDKLLEKLKERCRKIEFGSLTLQVEIHEGIIRQMEISNEKIRIR